MGCQLHGTLVPTDVRRGETEMKQGRPMTKQGPEKVNNIK